MGPIFGSVLSFFCAFHLLDPLATWLSPSFSLYLTRGVGGAAILLAAVWQVCCFASIQKHSILQRLYSHFSWPSSPAQLRLFARFFFWFAIAHIGLLALYVIADAGTFHASAFALISRRWLTLLGGFVATFFLAWSEELIFRGLLFDHFRRFHGLLSSAIYSSILFSLVHRIYAPWLLVTTEWRLGTGLFLLGMLLTIIAVWQRSLAASAGAHAGLVFIKVLLRKIPLVAIPLNTSLLFPDDLRTSVVTIEIMMVAIVALFTCLSRKKI
ncbi:MAG: CPBP family intramembrane metalloprotease [Candidatus Dependentiae bacterium]|jgi:membrane protease YdiL (CAAX protease family)